MFCFFLVFNPKTGNIISDLQQETLGQDSSKTKTKLDIPAADIHKSVISQNNGENTLPKTVIWIFFKDNLGTFSSSYFPDKVVKWIHNFIFLNFTQTCFAHGMSATRKSFDGNQALYCYNTFETCRRPPTRALFLKENIVAPFNRVLNNWVRW